METQLQKMSLAIGETGDPMADRFALPAELQELPEWFAKPFAQFLRSKQRNRPAKTVRRSTRQLFLRMKHMGKFFMEQYEWKDWASLSTRWLDDFIDHGLQRGLSPNTINWDLIHFCQFCTFLQESRYAIPKAVLRLKKLDVPKRLPRPLADQDVFVLEQTIRDARTGDPRWCRDIRAICDLAWFYLLWHCGLRLSEVCWLTLQDIDLKNGKLFVSNSKERKDRVIYMSETAVDAVRTHLENSTEKITSYVFETNGHAMLPHIIQRRLKMYGKRCGVQVSPHRLRHTFASQMLNVGMPITSLQRYMGHTQLDTTLNYAGVSDPVLRKEYNQAIRKVDPLWQRDEYAARLQIAQQRIQALTESLEQVRQDGETYLAALQNIQNLIDDLRKDVS
jgi:site-specific recombinase XerD